MSASDVPIPLVLLKIAVLLGGIVATVWLVVETRYVAGAIVAVISAIAGWGFDRAERRIMNRSRATSGSPPP